VEWHPNKPSESEPEDQTGIGRNWGTAIREMIEETSRLKSR
jgi:hypothetical protein